MLYDAESGSVEEYWEVSQRKCSERFCATRIFCSFVPPLHTVLLMAKSPYGIIAPEDHRRRNHDSERIPVSGACNHTEKEGLNDRTAAWRIIRRQEDQYPLAPLVSFRRSNVHFASVPAIISRDPVLEIFSAEMCRSIPSHIGHGLWELPIVPCAC